MSKFVSFLVSAMLISALIGALVATPSGDEGDAPKQRVNALSTAAPEPARAPAPHNAAYISRKEDGHYWTQASVDGTGVEFLVDTGASIVALTWRDALRLRLKPKELDFKWPIRTANGETRAAYVTLETIRIGNVKIENVDAMVMRDGLMESSLLGMSFLGELYSYEFKGDTLIIRQ